MLTILTSLVTLATTAITSITASLPTLGLALKAFIAKIPGPILEKQLMNILRLVGDIIKIVLNINSSCNELGYKARIADKKEEDFESTEKYLDYLDKEIKFDKEAFEKSSPLEQMECQLRGMGLAHKAIEEKFDISVSPLFLTMTAALGINPDVVVQCLNALKQANVGTDDFFAYFKGTCAPEKIKAVDEVVKKIFNSNENPFAVLDMQSKVREMGL